MPTIETVANGRFEPGNSLSRVRHSTTELARCTRVLSCRGQGPTQKTDPLCIILPSWHGLLINLPKISYFPHSRQMEGLYNARFLFLGSQNKSKSMVLEIVMIIKAHSTVTGPLACHTTISTQILLISCHSNNFVPLAGTCLCPLCHCGQVVSRAGLV